MKRAWWLFAALLACPPPATIDLEGGVGGGSGAGGGTAGTGGGTSTGGGMSTGDVTCTACVTASDCRDAGPCVQYAGSDFCGVPCGSCPAGRSCLVAVADDGTCGSVGCGTCPAGTTCDPIAGQCVTSGAGGGAGGGAATSDAGTCGPYDLPSTPSCCSSCTPGSGTCAANHCYGGWWCDRTTCRCHTASPTSCGGTGGGGGGSGGGAAGGGAGGAGGGSGGFTGYDGGVGPDGGAVSHLYFAVVGDTRPSLPDDTASYPTAIITKIYDDIAALQPRPQFVITTGDYMFASTSGTQQVPQMNLYMGARAHYPGTVFGVMGNHECTGATAGNCATSVTKNLTAYLDALVTPLGRSTPYYTFDVRDTAGQWTAKFIVTACNAWDATQKAWLTTELARPTTYTFIARHEPLGSNGPCNTEMDPMITAATFNGLLVGHTHSVYFTISRKQLVEGVGGAPITGTANYGYATVEQRAQGGFTIVQYDYASNTPVATYVLP